MKRLKDTLRSRRYPRRQAPQKNAGTLIARRLIVRALRKAGMSHVLKGGSATVGFLFPRSVATAWIHDAAIALLDDLTPRKHLYHLMFEAKKGKNSNDNAEKLGARLVESHLLFGFATDQSHFPDAFLSVADRVIALENVDLGAIEIAFRVIMSVNVPTETAEAAAKLPDGLLSAVIKPGRRLQDVIDILGRQTSSATTGTGVPTINTLSGYGEAAEWGQALATDLVEYGAGRIAWADIDRGALISGPSGTGKTFFVQSLAATCKIPIYAHSLARWQAKGHLGNLLAAMRTAFDQATENAPSILFLDEFDAFGSRDRFSGDNEQYCVEVVNGLLECLDGVEKRPGVVVIGATNLPERIDPALLRPGRLGRHLRIALPDLEARKGILRHHLGEAIPRADLSEVAARLEGATGAAIEQIVRDARRRSRSKARKMVVSDLTASLPARAQLSEEAFARTCAHEAGHALAGYVLRVEAGATPAKVKVFRELSETRAGSGYTTFHRIPGLDRSRRTYDAAITTLLAGLAAEKVLLGEHGDSGGGARGSDLHQATILAAGVVVSFGLGGALVYQGCDTPEQLLERIRADRHLRRQVDAMLGQCFDRAEAILLERKNALQAIAEKLKVAFEMNSAELADHIEH